MAKNKSYVDKYYDIPPNPGRAESAFEWGTSGATVGSAFGPWGAAIGGGLGLLGGAIFGGESEAEKQERLAVETQRNRQQKLWDLAYPQATGEVTPEQQRALDTLRSEYDRAAGAAGRKTGAALGRRGLRGPMAAGLGSRAYTNVKEAGARALTGQRAAWQQQARQQLAQIAGQQVPSQTPEDSQFWSNLILTGSMIEEEKPGTFKNILSQIGGLAGGGKPAGSTLPLGSPAYGTPGASVG